MLLLKHAGKLLRDARETLGLSQVDLAAATSWSQSTISLWEKGKPHPRLETALEHALLVKLDADLILTELRDALPALRAARCPIARDVELDIELHQLADSDRRSA